MTYLVIRPEGKCQDTCDYLQANGIDCVGLPLMSLESIANTETHLQKQLTSLRTNDWIIVTSTKAAELAREALIQYLNANKAIDIDIFGIGKSSADTLHLTKPIHYPPTETSEGLLNFLKQNYPNEFNNKEFSEKKRKIIILKGRGGRALLKTTFEKAGFDVRECDLYYRKATPEAVSALDWKRFSPTCVIATSGELIEIALNCPDAERLKSLPWIVVSERMATIAKGYGITNIYVSKAANKKALKAATSRFPEGKND